MYYNHGDIIEVIVPFPIEAKTAYGPYFPQLSYYPIGTKFMVDTYHKGIMLIINGELKENFNGTKPVEVRNYNRLTTHTRLADT